MIIDLRKGGGDRIRLTGERPPLLFYYHPGSLLKSGVESCNLTSMSSAIEGFWQYVVANRADLEAMASADDPAYDELLGMLQRIDEGLYIQFCSNPGKNELIITAEGETGLFPLVEKIVAATPAVEGWKIFALKPKIGFPNSMRWEDVTVTTAEVIACPVFERDTGDLGMQLYAPGVNPANKEKVHLALLQAMDSGLGEKRFALSIGFTSIHPLEDLPEGVTSFPLPELDRYLTWREEKIAEKDRSSEGQGG
jgi:hypothetical protein